MKTRHNCIRCGERFVPANGYRGYYCESCHEFWLGARNGTRRSGRSGRATPGSTDDDPRPTEAASGTDGERSDGTDHASATSPVEVWSLAASRIPHNRYT